MQYAYFLIVNILRMKLYWAILFCLLYSDENSMVFVFS